MQKLSFGAVPQKNTLKSSYDKKNQQHPIATPLMATTVVSAVGGGLGYVLPVTQNAFVNNAIYHKSDKLIKAAHDAYSISVGLAADDSEALDAAKEFIKKYDDKFSETDVKKISTKLESLADNFMYDIRIMLGKDAFKKVVSEIKNEKMCQSGKQVFDIVADEKQREIKEKYRLEFLDYSNKKMQKTPEYFSDVFKSVRKCNAKVVGLVLGLSTAVVSGLYSLSNYKKSKS